jgi:hypothetical protein
MKDNPYIRKLWEEFTEKYKIYFMSNEELWINNLNRLKQYIDENKKVPYEKSKDKSKDIFKIGKWLSHQKQNYKNNQDIMKDNPDIRKMWEAFQNEYKIYFQNYNELWLSNLNKVKEYININKMKPSSSNINADIRSIGIWILTQYKNYDKKLYTMKDPEIRKLWEEFTEQYKQYL